MRTVFISVVAVVAAGLLAGCGGAGGGPDGVAVASATAPQRIAVALGTATGGEGSAGIVLIDPSGRRVATLTARRAGREDSQPAWSPDGSRLAFTRTTDGRRSFHIYVMRADGTGVRRVTSGRFDFSPAWSADGRWIAYRANTSLRIVHPDGTGGRAVPTPARTFNDFPAWAPGGRIAYTSWSVVEDDSTRGWVTSQRLDGTARRRVVHGRDAHWSNDGTTIVYTGPDGGVFTAGGAGGAGRMLGRGFLAEWSRGGTEIAYTRMGDTYASDSVWVMNRDGSNPHRILRGGADPAWRP